jgi:osmotically-inducible protein OsmY
MQPPASTSTPAASDEDTKHGALGHLSAEEELQQTVCEALIEDGELDSSDIAVRVSQDTVLLSGSVKSREAWLRALSLAHAQRGVARVRVDDLHIREA